MGILENIFGGEETESKSGFDWNSISTEEEVEDILAASNNKPQVIFKHSTRCATSFFARKSLETFPETDHSKADFYMVNVINNRPISFFIADKLDIRHESPQLFIIKDGSVVWHGSHQDVQVDKLNSYLTE